MLAFGVFLACQLLRGGSFDPNPEGGVPRLDLLAAILVVIVARQVARFRAQPWPAATPHRAAQWALFPLVVLPAILDLAELWREGAPQGTGGTLAIGLLWIHWILRRAALAGLPLLSLWLALGTHIKNRRGAIDLRSFGADCARSIVDTLREWGPPLLLVLCYSFMGEVLERPWGADADARLAAIDRALFGGVDPTQAMQAWIRPGLSEWLALSYTFYAPLYPLTLGLVYGLGTDQDFRELVLTLCLTLAVGYAMYTVVPAQGPLFTERFSVPLEGYYFQWIKDQLLDRYRIPRDCFPSLHTAVALVFLASTWRRVRWFFWLATPLVGSIPLACVYFRYHYVADVLAGAALAAGVIPLGRALERRWGALAQAPLDRDPAAPSVEASK